MPKRIRRRSTNRVSNLFNTISGHSNSLGNYTNSIVSATIIYTSNSLLSDIVSDKSTVEIPILTNTQKNLLEERGVISPKIETEFSIIVDENINKIATIIKSEIISNPVDKYGLEKDDAEYIYEKFLKVYLDKGIYYLPNANQFSKYNSIIEDKMKENSQYDFRLNFYKDALTILTRNRTLFFDSIKFKNTITTLTTFTESAKTQIYKLTKKLLAASRGFSENFLCGQLGIKLKKPKPMIYAQAILNIYKAWYIYLYNTSQIDQQKYLSTISYVDGQGDKAYGTLIKLLDEKYKTFEDLLEEINDTIDKEDPSCSSYPNTSDSNTNSSDCTSDDSNTNCNSSDYTSDDSNTNCNSSDYVSDYTSDDSNTSDKEYDNCKRKRRKTRRKMQRHVSYLAHPSGGEMLLLDGKIEIKLKDNNHDDACKSRKTRKTRKRRKTRRKMQRHVSYLAHPSGCKMLLLDGKIDIKLKDNNHDDACKSRKTRKTRKRRKMQRHVSYLAHPSGGEMLLLDGKIEIKLKDNNHDDACKSRKKRVKLIIKENDC